jgi:hypothetical protein
MPDPSLLDLRIALRQERKIAEGAQLPEDVVCARCKKGGAFEDTHRSTENLVSVLTSDDDAEFGSRLLVGLQAAGRESISGDTHGGDVLNVNRLLQALPMIDVEALLLDEFSDEGPRSVVQRFDEPEGVIAIEDDERLHGAKRRGAPQAIGGRRGHDCSMTKGYDTLVKFVG